MRTVRRSMAAARRALAVSVFAALSLISGCATPMAVPVETQPAANPFLLPVGVSDKNFETTWERAVDVLHQYKFAIQRENRPAGTIETEYKVGSGLFEPWHPESVDAAARLESTFQSIRRKIILRVLPDDQGSGYLIGVEAFKEREDLPDGTTNTAGGGTFNEYQPGDNNVSLAVGETQLSGWIPLGRDTALERDLIQSLQIALTQ